MRLTILHKSTRSTLANKFFYFIVILGVVLGFSVSYLIGMFIKEEIHYDRFHDDYNQIYRVAQVGNYDGVIEKSSSCPFPLGQVLKNKFPRKITAYTRLYNFQVPSTLIKYKKASYHDNGFFVVDTGFFEIFTVNVIDGRDNDLLLNPNEAVISESAAKRYFGIERAVGRKLMIENKYTVTVIAVVKDWPEYSHFTFSVLVSMSTIKLSIKGFVENWIDNPCWTYIKVSKNINPKDFKIGLRNIVKQYFPKKTKTKNYFYLQPITEIHLSSHMEYEIKQNSYIIYLYVFGSITIFFLIMASINFLNITTATFNYRAKELAVKKLYGASRMKIVTQLLYETLYITFISSIIAIAVAELLMPWFNGLTHKHFEISHLLTLSNLLLIVLLNIIFTLVSGIFPALFLSKIAPKNIFRNNYIRSTKSNGIRKVLVFFQLFISFIIVYAAISIHDKYNVLISSDNGFNRDNIVVIPAQFSTLGKNFTKFKKSIENDSSVVGVAGSDYVPGINHNRHPFIISNDTAKKLLFLPDLNVVGDFLNVFNLNIQSKLITDSIWYNHKTKYILVNNLMVDLLKRNFGANFLQYKISTYDGVKIVGGIVKGFYPKNLKNKIEPFFINHIAPERNVYEIKYIYVKYNPLYKHHFFRLLNVKLRLFMSEKQPVIQSYKDIYIKQYEKESILNQISYILAIISLVISFTGLNGLLAFLLVLKKQIFAIYKISGASDFKIVLSLGFEFLKLYFGVLIISFVFIYLFSKFILNPEDYYISFSLVNYLKASLVIGIPLLLVILFQLRSKVLNRPGDILKHD